MTKEDEVPTRANDQFGDESWLRTILGPVPTAADLEEMRSRHGLPSKVTSDGVMYPRNQVIDWIGLPATRELFRLRRGDSLSAVASTATSNRPATRRYEFTANAERWGKWFVVQCIEHPGAISQVSELAEAGPAIVEAIAFVAQLPEDVIEVTVRERSRPAIDGSVPD